ncbi:MAG: hypothetical protein L0Y54_23655, partial [Sporichthyaceae bacterium]|nr:hypothetical protein [Sporichthyaceae bacterium]
MNAPGRPAVLGVGCRVRSGGVVRTVIGLAGTLVRLADAGGEVIEVALPVLQAAEDFALIDIRPRPLPPVGQPERKPTIGCT